MLHVIRAKPLPHPYEENMEIYKKYEPVTCIYCGSSDISAQSFDGEGHQREVICNDCKRYWTEQFFFDCIIVPDEFTTEVTDGA